MNVPRLRAPIVLAHGLFGFARLGAGQFAVNYFPGIPQALTAGGSRVLVAQVHPTASIASRAAELKQFIDREAPGEPVHLFGHSMGGLDARYMISRLGMGQRVLSLVTLGTPHRGTTFADWGIRRLERLVKPALKLIGIPTQGVYDLTTA